MRHKLVRFYHAAGVIYTLGCGLAGRPAVAAKLMEHDAIETCMGLMRQVPPAELLATSGTTLTCTERRRVLLHLIFTHRTVKQLPIFLCPEKRVD